MKLVIHGYGKMGRLVKAAATNVADAEVVSIIDATASEADFAVASEGEYNGVDAIIDFSNAKAVLPLLEHMATLPKAPAVVIATSGWNKQRSSIEKLIANKKLRVLYGANFALATALFVKIAGDAAKLIDKAGKSSFDVTVSETHHRAKADMPSGTAIYIGETLLRNVSSKKSLVYGNDKQQISADELQIASLRSGYNLGEHSVIFDSPDERITLHQQTTNRLAYAQGALEAAQWLIKQSPGKLYTFDDYLNEYLGA